MNDRMGREGQQFGNYRLLRALGQGGFADVYLGEHVYLDTQAAIKVLRTQLAGDEMEQFRSEARIVARLVHPHIVRVLEFGVEGATPYLVVDYAPNGTLRKRYPRGSRLPLISVISYVSQLADALQYAHDQKVIHRDVKPENMLIGRRNEILLSDFGIALLIQTSQYHSTQGVQDISGTVAYMAPEQIQYQASPASDQYALAVVVYEWLSGTRPFQGTFTEIAVKHALATPPPLHELSPSISSDIEAVIMKALSKDPKQRYATIREFAETLEKVARAQLADATATYIYTADASPPLEHATPPTSGVIVQEGSEQQEQGLSTFVIEETPSTSTIAVPSTETPSLPPPTKQISRRRVIWGLTGVGALAVLVGGSIPFILRNQRGQHNTTGSPTPVIVNGNTLYVDHGHTGRVWSVVWSPDSSRVASGSSDKTVRVWDATTGANPYTYSGHADTIYAVAWSPDGKRIASGSNDTTVQIWDASGGHPSTYTGHTSWVWGVTWAPDGTRLASASGDRTVQVWDAVSRQRIITYNGHVGPVYAVKWSPDGTHLASAGVDGTVQIWDANTGNPIHTYQSDASSIWSVAWSPNGKLVASAGNNNLVQVWGTNGDLPYNYHGHTDFVYTVTWSPDGKHLASGSDDETAQVWNTGSSDSIYVYTGHQNSVRSVAWSSNGKWLASGSWDKTVQVWQLTH